MCNLTRDRHDIGVMLISKENYFTFWPMVPAVISSDIDTRNVAQPLRRALIRAGASFRRASIDSVDYERKVVTADGQEFPYDQLVLSLGAEPAFFGIPGVEEHSLRMRGISDAEVIRNRVIERFEEVTLARGKVPESKLTFVVIGGGATGVETAAELHTLIHEALAPDYPNVDADRRARIVLLEGGPSILRELDPALRRAAHSRLVSRRIEVMTEARAQEVTENCVKAQRRTGDPDRECHLDSRGTSECQGEGARPPANRARRGEGGPLLAGRRSAGRVGSRGLRGHPCRGGKRKPGPAHSTGGPSGREGGGQEYPCQH